MAFDFGKHRVESLELYRVQRPLYEQFADSVRAVLRASISAECPIHSIEARAKGLDQFGDKCCKRSSSSPDEPKYPSPITQITDLAGVRVITFFPRNVSDVCASVESEFDVVERLDKGEELLADNRFGYQSIHYLIHMRPARTDLPEYKRFRGLVAEIQVRTILQHAWAEMEHDIQYKSAAAIPSLIRRRFMSLAGMLEIADREFQAIQDTDAEIRKQVRLPLDEELVVHEDLKVDTRPPEKQLADLVAEVPPENRAYVPGSARLLLASGYYADAIKAYDHVIQLHPKIHTNFLGRARARFLAGDSAGALVDLGEAWKLFPSDPQISRLRAQIEEGTGVTPEERAVAQREALEGNALLAAGNSAGALELYMKAEADGWNFIYSQFNKAFACCLAKDFPGMKGHLAKLRFESGTPFGITAAALNAIAALSEVVGADAAVADLQAQLAQLPTFSYARSNLRFLEEGIDKSDPHFAATVGPVFAALRRQETDPR
jgi:ppGpp synthetase/RelA/SpoT-type nucleotidyltranferase